MTMMASETYIKELQDKSYEELLTIRDELLNDVRYFEKHKDEIMSKEPEIHPSPDMEYEWNLEVLSSLFKLLNEKFREEYWEDEE